jgi:hypothetical protein
MVRPTTVDPWST